MLTARFKVESYFVVEELRVDFAGGMVHRHITAPEVDFDFNIRSFSEHGDHYNIVVSDTTIGVCDGGNRTTILNVPKSMITIANKHLMENADETT